MAGEPEVQEEGKGKEEGKDSSKAEGKGKEMLAVAAQHAAANQVAMEVKAEGKGKDKDEVAVAFKAEGTGKDEVAMVPMGAARSAGALEQGPHDERELEIEDLKFAVVWKNRVINYLFIMCLVLLGVIIHFSLQNAKNSHQKPKQTDTACAGSGQLIRKSQQYGDFTYHGKLGH